MFSVHILLLAITGGCLAQYDYGFPESLKTAAFEEIIGNYYAFDPFLQTGRKGRELNGHPDELEYASFQPTFDSSSATNSNDDITFYSIPPAYTESEAQDDFVEPSISVTIAPTSYHDARQLNDLQSNSPFTFETKLNSFDNENYPRYPPFSTEQSARQQQQLSPDVTAEEISLPKYVIGFAQEELVDEDKLYQKKRRTSARHHSGHRDQFVRQARPAIELDESPFAKRSLHDVNFDDIPQRYNRVRSSESSGRRAAEDIMYDRNIRNGYYATSNKVPTVPVVDKHLYQMA